MDNPEILPGKPGALPDFSGTWRFDASRSRLQISPPDTTTLVIDHRDPVFVLRRVHRSAGKEDEMTLPLTTDGVEMTTTKGGVAIRTRVWWEGEALVFRSVFVRDGAEKTNEVRYRLAGDGNTLCASESFRGGQVNYDNLWIMERVFTASS